MRQVPAYYKQFLLIETPRSDHMLEASNFMMEICLPSVSGNFIIKNIFSFKSITYEVYLIKHFSPLVMILIILLIMVCAWEGWFCRNVVEGEELNNKEILYRA